MLKKILRSFNRGILILFFFGGMIVYQSAGDFFVLCKPAKILDSYQGDFRPGMHITGEVFPVLGSFASEESWTENGSSRTASKTSGHYYVYPAGNGTFLGMKAPAKLHKQFLATKDATYAALANGTTLQSDPIDYEGVTVKMEDDLQGYLVKWVKQSILGASATDANAQALTSPIIIEYRAATPIRVMFLVGVVLLGLGGFLYWRSWQYHEKLDKQSQEFWGVEANI